MGKHSLGDDEIPLTHTGSNVTKETRARFDSLLSAALEQELESNKHLQQEQKDNVEKNTTLLKRQTKKRTVHGKGSVQHNSRKSSSTNVEESPFKSLNTSVQTLSSSEDDVITKEKFNRHVHKDDKVYTRRNGNDSNENAAEQLVHDKSLKDERNANQISQKEEISRIADIDNENGRLNEEDNIIKCVRKQNIESESSEHVPSSIKKPVPLPRSKIKKRSSEQNETIQKTEDEFQQHNIPISRSIISLLPLDQPSGTGGTAGGGDEDDDSDNCVLPQKVERKKKRKKKSASNEIEEQEEIELKNVRTTATIEDEGKETSQRRRSSFHKSRRKNNEVGETTLTTVETNLSYEKIVGIFIHRSECLQIDPLVRHPLVKVHLLDATTGNYLKKSNTNRSVSFYYENTEVDYILPLMTEVFDYKERRSIVPFWEELLVFNEDFEYIIQDDPPALILFEILDFVNFNVASSQYRRLGSEGGWHHIAWAFLKPVGANGIFNTEKQVRLQLYKPQHTRKPSCNGCVVYEWWNGGVWERYPATLYVTVKSITPPEHLPPVLRSRSALQGELSQSPPFLDLDRNLNNGDTKSDNDISMASAQLQPSTGSSLPVWSRLPSQSCKIPNHRKCVLPTASRGCFNLKFSNSGLYLACSVAGEEKYIIIVYSMPDGEEIIQFLGHQGLVYDLHWSAKDTMLLSASADCTACLWDVDAQKPGSLQMLPHPSFVYCAQFHPGNSSVLVTGCCDHVVRVWNRPRKSSRFELVQELEGHTGFVSAVTMNSNGILYSADSIGRIIEWMGTIGKSKKQYSFWKLNRNMDIRELREIVINKLQIHPGGQRLLIHARDSRLRMMDVATASIIQWFNGALNHRVQTSVCLSPCGSLVFAASEDGTVHVWNADTGEQLAIYSGLQFHRGASSVDYHPYEHMAAFASYGTSTSVVVCDYDKLSSGKDMGLQMLFRQERSIEGTLQSTGGDISESLLRSSTSFSFFHKELNLPSLKRKTKKAVPINDAGEMNISQQGLTLCTDGLLPATETSASSLSPKSNSVASPWKENDNETSKARLASIIEKMDQVLSRTPSKSSQQNLESVNRNNLDSKLSDTISSKTKSNSQTPHRRKHKQSDKILHV